MWLHQYYFYIFLRLLKWWQHERAQKTCFRILPWLLTWKFSSRSLQSHFNIGLSINQIRQISTKERKDMQGYFTEICFVSDLCLFFSSTLFKQKPDKALGKESTEWSTDLDLLPRDLFQSHCKAKVNYETDWTKGSISLKPWPLI